MYTDVLKALSQFKKVDLKKKLLNTPVVFVLGKFSLMLDTRYCSNSRIIISSVKGLLKLNEILKLNEKLYYLHFYNKLCTNSLYNMVIFPSKFD